MLKRNVSLILAIVMVLTMIPNLTAFAAETAAGGVFDLWNTNAVNQGENDANSEGSIYEDPIYAQQFTITFETNGGTPVDPITQYYSSQIYMAPLTAKDGLIFLGWYTDAALTAQAVFPYTITGNATLYAKWNGYDSNDFSRLQVFLNQPSAIAGKSNGQAVNPAYDPDDPATWTGVSWLSDNPVNPSKVQFIYWPDCNLSGALDLSGLTVLKSLECSENQIETIDLSQDAALTFLGCTSNQLETLELGDSTAVQTLNCSENQLTLLDLSRNTALTFLSCSSNRLETLELGGNTALTHIDCSINRLTSLDVHANTALIELYCASNRLTNLDVSSNTELKNLYLFDNRLGQLDVSLNTKLEYFVCSANKLLQITAFLNNADISLQTDGEGCVSLTYSKSSNELYAIAEGYGFENWTTGSGEEFSRDNQLNLTLGTDYDLTANFSPADYNAHDVATIQNFLSQPSALSGKTNAEVLGYDSSAPGTWTNVYWNIGGSGELEIQGIFWSGNGDGSGNLAGSLDLSGCVSLSNLDCQNNKVVSLNAAGCPNLNSINCNKTGIAELDITGDDSLVFLNCSETGLESLDVSGLTALESLVCFGSADLASLNVAGCTSLKHLNCSQCNLASLDAGGLSALEGLVCFENAGLTSLNVAGCTNLNHLNCSKCNLASLDAGGLSALEGLFCFENPELASLNISGCGSLKELDCTKDNVSSLDAGGLSNLESLLCRENPNLSVLNISGCGTLKRLDCSNGKLASLDVSGAGGLVELRCGWNALSSLNINGLASLERLDCGKNNLTSLDVSASDGLIELYCYENAISTLDLNGCASLQMLQCSENDLTALDLEGCGSLNALYCNGNGISSLDLSGLGELQKLAWAGNQLTSVDLSANTKLKALDLQGNELTSIKATIQGGSIELEISGEGKVEVAYNLGDLYEGSGEENSFKVYAYSSGPKPFSAWMSEGATVSTDNPIVLTAGNDYHLTAVFEMQYDAHDLAAITDFLNQPSAQAGKTNAEVLGYDVLDPETWTNVHWQTGDSGVSRLSGIFWGNDGDVNGDLAGNLDLSGCQALDVIECGGNKINSVNAANCTLLKSINCRNNRIANIDVSGCGSLVHLNCSQNNISSLDASGLEGLDGLFCSENPNLTALNVSGCSALKRLDCSNGKLASLDVSGSGGLMELRCFRNALLTLNVNGLSSLEILDCGSNSLTSLDVAECTKLKELYCYQNSINVLDLSALSDLERLDCGENNLNSLDIGASGGLKELYCFQNAITTLDLSGNASLQKLQCSENDLTALDLEGCGSLNSLYCNGNSLTSLDLSGLGELQYFACGGNQLTAIDISANTKIKALDLQGNNLSSIKANIKGGSIELSSSDEGKVELAYNLGDLYEGSGAENSFKAYAYPFGPNHFAAWTSGGAPVSTDNPLVLTAGNHYNLNAVFEVRYNAHDLAALTNFLNQSSAQAGKTNAEVLGYDLSSPETWSHVSWDMDGSGEMVLRQVDWVNDGDGSGSLAGELDLSGCGSLVEISCQNNKVTSLKTAGCPNLRGLYCINTEIAALDLTGDASLEDLDCSRTKLSDLNVSGLSALKTLICMENPGLKTLAVAGCASLKHLDCSRDDIASLDVSGLTALERLYCRENNGLSSLNINGCNSLIELDCSQCGLKSLDAGGLAQLKSMYCYQNSALTSLNVNECSSLETLCCNQTGISDLDVSGLDNLRELQCLECNLSSIDLKDNINLKIFTCYSNNIQTIDLSANTKLDTLECINNPLREIKANISGASINMVSSGDGFVGLTKNQTYFYEGGTDALTAHAYPNGVAVFLHWTSGGAIVSSESHFILEEGQNYNNLAANFASSFTVKFISGSGSPVPDQTVVPGGHILKPDDPVLSGYTFKGWFKEANYVNAWDFVNDTVNRNITLYAKWVDDLGPTCTGLSPANGFSTLSQTFAMQAAGVSDPSGVSSVLFAVYNEADGGGNYVAYPGIRQDDGSWLATFDANKHKTKIGKFYINVWATDLKGNKSFLGQRTAAVLADTAAPTLTGAVTPANGATLASYTFTMQAAGVTDPSGVSSVLFAIYNEKDGASSYVAYPGVLQKDGSWQAAVDTARNKTRTGKFHINIWGTDKKGNMGCMRQIIVTVSPDLTPPMATGITPAAGTVINAATFTAKAAGVTDPSGVSSVLFAVYNEADGAADYVAYPGVRQSDGSWQALIDTARNRTKTGKFYINVWATDLKGNRGCIGQTNVVVPPDTAAPTMTGAVTPANGATLASYTFTMQAAGVTDPSGVSSVLFAVYNEKDGAASYVAYPGVLQKDGSWQAAVDTARNKTRAGKFHINIWGTDKKGNMGCMRQIIVTVSPDLTPPTATGITPAAGTVINAATFTAKAAGVTDPSGVSSVLFAVYNEADGGGNYVTYPGVRQSDGSWQALIDTARNRTKTGKFYINIWATDLKDNRGCIGQTNVVVPPDTAAPTLTGAVTPANGATLTSYTFTMKAAGITDPSGVSSVLFAVYNEKDGAAGYVAYPGVLQKDGSWQAAVDTTRNKTRAGKFYINIWGTDKKGNMGCMRQIIVTVSP